MALQVCAARQRIVCQPTHCLYIMHCCVSNQCIADTPCSNASTQKVPGKFYPVDVCTSSGGAGGDSLDQFDAAMTSGGSGLLDARVAGVVKMIFNVDTMRSECLGVWGLGFRIRFLCSYCGLRVEFNLRDLLRDRHAAGDEHRRHHGSDAAAADAAPIPDAAAPAHAPTFAAAAHASFTYQCTAAAPWSLIQGTVGPMPSIDRTCSMLRVTVAVLHFRVGFFFFLHCVCVWVRVWVCECARARTHTHTQTHALVFLCAHLCVTFPPQSPLALPFNRTPGCSMAAPFCPKSRP